MTVDELLLVWKKKADYGTFVHEEIENYINDKTPPTDDRSCRAVKWLNGYKMQSNYKLLSEKIIYSKELNLAGTIDLLMYDESSNAYNIIDWKTSAKIETSAYRHKTGNNDIKISFDSSKKVLPPIFAFIVAELSRITFNILD